MQGGVPVPEDMDGRSVLPLLEKYSQSPPRPTRETLQWTQTFLIESSGRRESSTEQTHSKSKTPHGESSVQAMVSEEEQVQVNELCDLHPYPCLLGQRKYCRREKGRFRFRKCRVGTDFIVEEELKSSPCQCPTRARRDAPENSPSDFNWESERQKIDTEIEVLKSRIDELREKKRLLRQQWTSTVGPPISKVTERRPAAPENESSGKERGKKKNQIHISILRTPRPTPLDTTERLLPSTSASTYLEKDRFDTDELEEGLGHAEHGILEDDLFVSPVTFIHSDEEDTDDDEDKVISKLPNNSQTLLNGTIYMANTKESQRKNRNRGQALGFSPVNQSYHEWAENREGPFEVCDCSKLQSDPRWLRMEEREERKRKKLMSKLRKKQRFLNRIQDPTERQQVKISCTY